MSSLKEKYEDHKINTVDKFYQSFERVLIHVNSPNVRHYLKDSITNLKMDNDNVSFQFLPYNIRLKYTISLNMPIGISAYKEERDTNNYPTVKLVPIPALDFQFSTAKNGNGFKDYQFNGKNYCLGNASEQFFVDYLKTLQTAFFPE